ncbi:MAG: 1-acyl-sn-glycerol-3-phosphate acyltransferase [Bacilli bacterium]|jgi:1-acyl-sn-glycerol-3-phosphate acyltransferase|nr:1-acyl-sn-glycerol-3-phosphate acyltransferase [Bacilli bacterium]
MRNSRKNRKKHHLDWLHAIISGFFYYTLKPFFNLGFKLFHNLHYNHNGYKLPKGPLLFVSNHHSNYDGMYMDTMFYSRIIHFVVNEEMFYNRLTSFFSGWILGEIKRGMSPTDVSYIRELKRLVKKGRSIGLYAEGDISMFGDTLPVDMSLAKLAKMLDIPVVVMRITGAHLRAPRVANKARRSKITYTISDIIPQSDVRDMELNALYNRIVAGYSHHENAWQHENMVKLGHARHRRAEWLELGLFRCPSCGQYQSLHCDDNDFYCDNCDFHTHVNQYSFFDYDATQMSRPYPKFSDTSAWNDWQLEQLYNDLSLVNDPNQLIFSHDKIRFHTTKVGTFFRHKYITGTINLFGNRVELLNSKGRLIYTIPFDEKVIRCLVQYKDVYEIDRDDTRYRVWAHKRVFSGHLFVSATNYLRSKK